MLPRVSQGFLVAKAKPRTVFVCDNCGNDTPRWEGRCPSCGEWNTLAEHRQEKKRAPASWTGAPSLPAQELSQVAVDEHPRRPFASEEVNRVLGGGIVPGSVVLIAGDPGIGKSTLLLRLAGDLTDTGGEVLYVSGEESTSQIKMRAERLGISGRRLLLLQTTSLGAVIDQLNQKSPALVVVDSIQTMYDDSVESAAGSVSQVRECTRTLMQWAKIQAVPVVLAGHVTKGGDIAGPRALEHMVDVVLYMEGDPISSWRLLRAVKNRFGTTNEIGVFEMTDKGLIEVDDPSAAFLSERQDGSVGSVIVATLEGSRPLLVEVQALTNPSALPAPRRVATGIDFNRLLVVCAVLTRRAGISLADQDVIVNVTGGLHVSEPAADLGMALAIASSYRNVPVARRTAAVGEIGLSGEVRRVPQLSRRLSEAGRLGLQGCLVPPNRGDGAASMGDLSATPVATLRQAVNAALESKVGGRVAVDAESTGR